MELNAYFKSIIDQDHAAIVICDCDCRVVYVNPAAKKAYKIPLVGTDIANCHNAESNVKIRKVVEWFKAKKDNNVVFTFYNEKQNKDVYMVALRDEAGNFIGFYEKHEFRTKETRHPYDVID